MTELSCRCPDGKHLEGCVFYAKSNQASVAKYDYKNIVGSRGIRVNVFKDDTEQDIHLRLIRAITDEYFEDHAPDVVDSPVKGEHETSQQASPPPPLLELDEIFYALLDIPEHIKMPLGGSWGREEWRKAVLEKQEQVTALLNSKLIEARIDEVYRLKGLYVRAEEEAILYITEVEEIFVNRIAELKAQQGDQS